MIHTWTGYYLQCDHAGCETTIPRRSSSAVAWESTEACYSEAMESCWVTIGDKWLCFDHWTTNDDDEIVEMP